MAAAQLPPNPDRDLSGFPSRQLTPDDTLYRAAARTRNPGYFAADDSGRFNLRPPRGTLYSATDLDTAVREKVREAAVAAGIISRRLANSFRVVAFAAPAVRAADLAARTAARFGVIRELAAMDDYDIPRRWATAFDESGFGGVHYGSRFTTGEPSAWGIFGAAGEHDLTVTAQIEGSEACEQVGIAVTPPIPSADSVDLLD
ncbi:MAG: RES family NAD+ phosphorylase [Pseudoclavibacter sp.]